MCIRVGPWLALGLVILISAPLYSQRPLSYMESSDGLDSPRMERGRTEIVFGDIDGDGNVDIVSIGDHGSPGLDEHGIMVWFGDGRGNWSVVQSGRFGYGGVALGDVNNDGLMDVGFGMHHNYSGEPFGNRLLGVALGDGTGENWTPWDEGLATSGETWGMFETDFADVDNDGFLDLGSISFGCCAGLHIYRNNGDGTWAQSFGFVGGNARNNFFFGDINGDGNADFASGHSSGTVYFGDGRGGFALADGNLPPAGSVGRRGVSLGDVNDDGRDDLAFVTSSGGLAVWSWASDGVWQDLSGSLPVSGDFGATQIADMNLDGHGDLIAFGRGRVVVYTGDGLGNWELAAEFDTPGTRGVAAFRAGVDLDHNGFPDIGVVASEGGRNRPRVFLENSVPTELRIYPKYPRGGETFIAGSVRFIEWSAALPPRLQKSAMTLELSLNGPDGPWRRVADAVPNNGRYQWLIPPTLPTSIDCYLRYMLTTGDGDAGAMTPAAFTIVAISPQIPE
ncbi:MAG: VCBS repeat-containing protein [Acidobacteria bacterium]|nr:VCBS repeat-containing protein [Acidobacteriota bacterium]MBI3656562.1 VCBS repeat-containing protein [Acidobacteriota bacterium]